jgi:hypothetical protein
LKFGKIFYFEGDKGSVPIQAISCLGDFALFQKFLEFAQ